MREQVFLRELYEILDDQMDFLPGVTRPVRVSVVVNGKLGVGQETVQACALEVAGRSVQLLLDEALVGNLLRIYLLCQDHNWDYRMVRIPAAVPVDSDSHAFSPETMARLFEVGEDLGRGGTAWETRPPTALGP